MLTQEGLLIHAPLDGSGNSSGKWSLSLQRKAQGQSGGKSLTPIDYGNKFMETIFLYKCSFLF